MSPGVRWIVGGAALVALLATGIALRRYVAQTETESTVSAPRLAPTRFVPHRPAGGGDGGTDDEGLDGSARSHQPLSGNEPLAAREAPPAAIPPGATGVAGKPGTAAPVAKGQAGQIGTGGAQSTAQASGGTEPGATPDAGDSKTPALALAFSSATPSANQPAPVISKDVQLDPNLDATLFPPTASFALPDRGGIDPNQGTLAVWIRMKDVGGNGRAILDLSAGTWENHLNLAAGPTFARFLLTTTDGSEVVAFAHTDFSTDNWHNAAVTWGEAQATIYIDGQAQDSTTYSGSFTIPPGALLYVASPRGGYDPSPGVVALRDLQTYQRILAPEEIAALVEQTVPPK
ncbi:MAG TPA: LamG domain-containing protein [Candidatus Kryptonia bacterium]|nr:LamG domain-containing protein [Candidatus Kryptonia bacterium]